MAETIMGMSIASFVAAIFSAIGCVWTLITAIRSLVPTQAYGATMDNFIKALDHWDELLELDPQMSPKRKRAFAAILTSIQDDIKALLFISRQPRFNLGRVLRSMLKSRKVSALSNDVNKIRIELAYLIELRKDIRDEKEEWEEGTSYTGVEAIEKRYRTMADIYIGSFRKRYPPPNEKKQNGEEDGAELSVYETEALIQPPEPIATPLGRHRLRASARP